MSRKSSNAANTTSYLVTDEELAKALRHAMERPHLITVTYLEQGGTLAHAWSYRMLPVPDILPSVEHIATQVIQELRAEINEAATKALAAFRKQLQQKVNPGGSNE